MGYPNEESFERWLSNNLGDLQEEFCEDNDNFNDFCWKRFESYRQNYDDIIAEGQVEDLMLEQFLEKEKEK
jgi:hypothetical protein